MAATLSVGGNANPQRQPQPNKPETSSEPVKPSEAKGSTAPAKVGGKKTDPKNHQPPILPGFLPDARPHDPNVFFAGNGFAPQYFFDYSGAGFAGQPALSHLPWEEYNRLMAMNGPDGQPIFNGELGPVFFQAPPEFLFPNQSHFPFGGAPSMGADGQLYGPHAFHTFGHVFPPGQFIPQSNGSEPSTVDGKNFSQSNDKSQANSNGIHPNSVSSSLTHPRGTSPGTVENSVKQVPHDANFEPAKTKITVQNQNRILRDHPRPLESNQPLPFPRVVPPPNGFSRVAGRGQTISGNGFFDARAPARGWVAAADARAKGRVRGFTSLNGDVVHDIANEQNRGPRTVRAKPHQAPNGSGDTSKLPRLPEGVLQGDYNNPNFSVTYPAAKFFVIKSYSEDDVHKSIKYNVWASTPNGNKRLDAAFKEASQVKDGCPVFLFFSVNASGQFCGVAEMTTPIDFSKSVEYWQQDKWNGQFGVKWHIIKDVPNGQFRHILLANNENKPVTNSRDTQEVRLDQGLEMLSIFKKFSAKTSILDDFAFYDNRQMAMQEKKAKLTLQHKPKPQVPLKQIITGLHSSDRKDFSSSASQLLVEIAKNDERDVIQPKASTRVPNNEPTSIPSVTQANSNLDAREATPNSGSSIPPSAKHLAKPDSPDTADLASNFGNLLTIDSKGLDTAA